jgi:hypothetical protein
MASDRKERMEMHDEAPGLSLFIDTTLRPSDVALETAHLYVRCKASLGKMCTIIQIIRKERNILVDVVN